MVNTLSDTTVRHKQSNGSKFTDDKKFTFLILSLVELLTIKYLPNDDFKGYRNIVIALELLDSRDIEDCVGNNFLQLNEIIGDQKHELGQLMFNLVMSNLTNTTCTFIFSYAQNASLN